MLLTELEVVKRLCSNANVRRLLKTDFDGVGTNTRGYHPHFHFTAPGQCSWCEHIDLIQACKTALCPCKRNIRGLISNNGGHLRGGMNSRAVEDQEDLVRLRPQINWARDKFVLRRIKG